MENLLPPFEPEKARAEALARAKHEDADHKLRIAERIRAAPRLPGKADMLLDKRLDQVISSNASTRGEDHRQTVPRLLKPTQGLYGGNRGESPLMAAFKNMKVARQSLGATSTALRPVLSEEKSMVPSQGSPRQRSDHKQGRRFVSDELHQPVQILNASQNVPCMLFRRGARMRMQELAPEHRTDAKSSIGDVMTCILMPRVPKTGEWAATVGPNVRSPTSPQERAEIDVANRHPRAELVVQSIDAKGQLNTISVLRPGASQTLDTWCNHPWLLSLRGVGHQQNEVLLVAHRSASASRHNVHISWNGVTKAVTLTSGARPASARLALEMM